MIIRVRYNYVRLFLCLNKKVLPIFGVIQTGGGIVEVGILMFVLWTYNFTCSSFVCSSHRIHRPHSKFAEESN